MKLKITIAAMALLAIAGATHAQEKKTNPNPWFIQGQLGASYASGDAAFGKLVSPAGALAFGKYFSPVWGARFSVSGWQGRTGSEVTKQAHSFYYGAATVDGLMNLSQLIKKYPERLFDVNVIAGIGFNRAFTRSVSSFMGRLGLQGSFRLNEAIDFNVEATANGVSDRWNGRNDHGIDTYFNLGLGFTYKFGTGFKCPTCISEEYPEVSYTEEQMNELINKQRGQVVEVAKIVTDTVLIEKDCPPAAVVRGIRSHVTFNLGKIDIQPSQEMNVMVIADYLKRNPEANATISGYADKGTGTREINLRLAKQRAEVVRQCLVEKHGVSKDRLMIFSMEAEEQPFEINDWNRVVIIIAD